MANFPSRCPLTAHWLPTETGKRRQKIRLFASNPSGNMPTEIARCPLKKRILEQQFSASGQWEGFPLLLRSNADAAPAGCSDQLRDF
jgi:hypothetical protein